MAAVSYTSSDNMTKICPLLQGNFSGSGFVARFGFVTCLGFIASFSMGSYCSCLVRMLMRRKISLLLRMSYRLD